MSSVSAESGLVSINPFKASQVKLFFKTPEATRKEGLEESDIVIVKLRSGLDDAVLGVDLQDCLLCREIMLYRISFCAFIFAWS